MINSRLHQRMLRNQQQTTPENDQQQTTPENDQQQTTPGDIPLNNSSNQS